MSYINALTSKIRPFRKNILALHDQLVQARVHKPTRRISREFKMPGKVVWRMVREEKMLRRHMGEHNYNLA
jgi:hypothetical protein